MSAYRTSYRGPESGSGSRGKWSWRGGANAGPPRTLPPPKPLGPTIDSININTLLTEENSPTIEHVKYVASYNWVDGKSPVILVPGSPPAWTPPAADAQLKPDSEDVYRDINAARYPSYPMEPMFRSLQTMQPDHDLQAVDIVGCGSTLGNLLRFARSESKPFRFDVDAIGETVIFVRRESSPTELITGLYGYGHTFPEAYTRWDSEVWNSCSHQPIIQYDFGGLTFLVRTETDAYVREAGAKTSSSVTNPINQLPLDDAFEAMAVRSTGASDSFQLELKMQGMKVNQDQIFDIKTRASHKSFDMNEILPRLWLNQTPKFLIAYHQSGLFNKPKVEDVWQGVTQWENDNSALLARFHAVVKRIVDVVRDSDQQQYEVSWDGQGPLCVTKQIGGRRALSPYSLNLLEG